MLSFRNASCYGSAFLSFLTPTSPPVSYTHLATESSPAPPPPRTCHQHHSPGVVGDAILLQHVL